MFSPSPGVTTQAWKVSGMPEARAPSFDDELVLCVPAGCTRGWDWKFLLRRYLTATVVPPPSAVTARPVHQRVEVHEPPCPPRWCLCVRFCLGQRSSHLLLDEI